jgi:hypothetical protein
MWIIAAAISVVAVRYTFFPPCCESPPQYAMKTLCFRDSVVPIPGSGCDESIAMNEALVRIPGDSLEIRGTRNIRIGLPPEGLLVKLP